MTSTLPERRADPRVADDFRHVMGHVPTGVAVVAASTPEGPAGLTVGTFVSASLDPPLVGLLVAHTSRTWPRVEAADSLCVNVLGEDQEHVCRRFAVSGGDKFSGLRWRPAPSGAPIVEQALAWFDCTVRARHEAGDHWFVLADVHALGVRSSGHPLVFCHGAYRQLDRRPLVAS
jgi:flavin reductase (DIM6/NTAB) family NADH-FMN oxidoreductase RutF